MYTYYDVPNLDDKAVYSSTLYTGLGSFWTQIFQDKQLIQGFVQGWSEEMVQSYYDLIEVVNSYSVSDCPVFHKQRWQPITIQKSLFNSAPFVFSTDNVFGAQPDTNTYYAGTTFRFGLPKSPNANVYTYSVGKQFTDFSLIADRVINPTSYYVNGVDVFLQDGILYFNQNIFNDSSIPQKAVINPNGVPATYVDSNGVAQVDTVVIVWAYNTSLDTDYLYDNFGTFLNLRLTSSEDYKGILASLFGLYENGPTVAAIKTLLAALLGFPVVSTDSETIENIISNSTSFSVVTDKNVYRYAAGSKLATGLSVGSVVLNGTVLVTGLEFLDNQTVPHWWLNSFNRSEVAISSNVFVGSYKSQLFFTNGTELVTTDSSGNVLFPVSGDPDDVATFNSNLNGPNQAAVKAALGLTSTATTAPINPLDFLFSNFFANNTSLIKLSFSTSNNAAFVLSTLDLITPYLPAHVYLLYYITLNVPSDVYDLLNGSTTLTGFSGMFNSDGSTSSGTVPTYIGDTTYYKDLDSRFFEVGKAPKFSGNNYDTILATATSGNPSIKPGKVFSRIPAQIITNGVQTQPTTANVGTLLLIDFS